MTQEPEPFSSVNYVESEVDDLRRLKDDQPREYATKLGEMVGHAVVSLELGRNNASEYMVGARMIKAVLEDLEAVSQEPKLSQEFSKSLAKTIGELSGEKEFTS